MKTLRYLGWGALAGAAGSTALNAVTYLDMAARGRPASSTPETTAETLAEKAGTGVPGDEETRQNRLSGMGPLFGTVAGVSVGAVFGLFRRLGFHLPGPVDTVVVGAAMMAASDGTMTALGVTNPKEWDGQTWVTDLVPHLAYGAVTVATLHALDRR